MPFIRYLLKIEQLDNLIRKKATGNQLEFAKKANISRSLLNIYIGEMKQMGFPIAYSRSRRTYYYMREGKMVKNLFEDAVLSKEGLMRITGGQHYFFDMPNESHITKGNTPSPTFFSPSFFLNPFST